MNTNWNYHDDKMRELKRIYNKFNEQTKNRLQEIFKLMNIPFDKLYTIADLNSKKKINTYIEEWKEKGLLKGYFKNLAESIYRRTKVKCSDILHLLIYAAYMEEQQKVQDYELNIMKDVANNYYREAQDEVNKKTRIDKRRKVSDIKDAIFLYLLTVPNSKGYTFEQYIEMRILNNVEQMYRQVCIDIQQGKEVDIDNDIYKKIIKKQQNARLCINDDKISGDIDTTLIGINNQAKIEGIKIFDDKAIVKFVSVNDERRTKMCSSLEGKYFFVHDWNEFERYSAINGKKMKYKCYGLVPGLNLPPINDNYHCCRSTVIYVENNKGISYNENDLDIPKISKDVKPILENKELNSNIKKLFNKYLTSDNVIIDNNDSKPMYYDIQRDKIIINPNHKDFKYYDIQESLSHEIIHMIDVRNKISDKLSIDNELRRARLSIDIDEDKYINMFNDTKYEDNMTLSDIFSAITNGKISGNYKHSNTYWLEDITRVEKEISANIMSAYLTMNKDTMEIINSINSLKEIKEKVVKLYDDYTR